MKPGRALFVAALLWLLLGGAGFFGGTLFFIWLLWGFILLPFILADALILFFFSIRPGAERDIPGVLAQGEPVRVRIGITKNAGGSAFRDSQPGTPRRKGPPFLPATISLFDIYPDSMECNTFPLILDRKLLKQEGTLILDYTLLPVERGAWEFPGLQLLLGSPLRFWQLRITRPEVSRGRTYPNFRQLTGKAGTDVQGILEKNGAVPRKRGEGMEFESLREYQKGDSIRAIDWRATGRRGKIIIREYQEEQDQQVLFLLDAGYRLHRREGNHTQFDRALDAMLLLSWVALKHGDRVAVGTFGADERWLPPRKGISALTGIMNSLGDLKSSPAPSSPLFALENALDRLHRRTFIILLSNFREEDGESLAWILPRVQRRHLLLLVSLRELEAEALAARHPADADEALETAAAFSYIASRRRLYQTWERSGLLTLEAAPAELSPALINRYLQVKRSGRL